MKVKQSLITSTLIAVGVLLLTGCAGELTYRDGLGLLRDGHSEEALSKFEQAVREAPDNHEFRLRYLNARATVIDRLMAEAQAERDAAHLDEAAAAFRHVLKIDPENPQALAGLGSLEQIRRHASWLAEADAHFKAGERDAAEFKLNRILQENPQHGGARQMQRLIEETSGQNQIVPSALRNTLKRPISLEFRDANIKQVIEAVSRHSGINFVLDREIPPGLTVTVFLRQVSIEDALEVVLYTHQLEKRILNDNTLLIYPNTASKQSEHQDLMVKAFYLSNADAKQVMGMLKTVLKAKNVYVDEKLNLLLMRDTPAAIRLADRLVAMQDIHEPEVMLEVEVLEVKRSRLLELGIRFPEKLTLTPLPSNGTTLTLNDIKNANSASLGTAITNTEINLRREVGDANILANPRIRARNREKAQIKIGDRVPVITTTTTATGFVAENVQYLDVGLKLDVEPTIYTDDEVVIRMGLEVSSVVKQLKSSTGSITYQIGSRNASSVLRLKDGETQILGGLISDEDRRTANRIPGLGDLPILGRLFSSQLDDNQKTELILSITPRLVRGVAPPANVPNEFWTGTENNLRIRPLGLSAVDVPDKPAAASAPGKKATALPAVSAPKGSPVILRWDGAAQARVGEILSLSLNVTSQDQLHGLPLQVKYDPKIFNVQDVRPGNFMGQGDTKVGFSKRIIPGAGMIFITQNSHGTAGASGKGELVTIDFKAIQAAERSVVTVLPATPMDGDGKPMQPTSPTLMGVTVQP